MRRRGALLAILSLGVLGPLRSHAQQPGRTYRVGLFLTGSTTAVARQRTAIVERLATQGFAEGRNLLVISGQLWVNYGMEHIADQIIRFADEKRTPSIFWESEIADRGATLAYGVNSTKELGRAADPLARVLKGAKPAELPVDQATSYELVVNSNAARALRITIPTSILVRADRVIE